MREAPSVFVRGIGFRPVLRVMCLVTVTLLDPIVEVRGPWEVPWQK